MALLAIIKANIQTQVSLTMEFAYITSTIKMLHPGFRCCLVELLFVELNLGTVQ